MTTEGLIKVVGGTGSPYTQKIVALLRYRRIPYAIIWGQPKQICEELDVTVPKPILMPTVFFQEDGALLAQSDSTPIIRRLESIHRKRSVLPSDPALAFLDYLIEDFADEWCTKYMFHYRWYSAADADNAGTLLPLGMDVSIPQSQLLERKEFIEERQIERLWVVGSNDITAPIIDASYCRFLEAMEAHLAAQHFMLGYRPGAGDFGLFGQLTQLVGFDPTPRAIAHSISPRTVAWVDQMADAGGFEPKESDWLAIEEQPASLMGLLNEIGRVYAPAQLANSKAVMLGEETWQCEIDGSMWRQRAFPYQAKCLKWTRDQYSQLSDRDRDRIDSLLLGTGIENMLVDSKI